MSIVVDENLIGVWYAVTGESQDYMMAITRCDEGIALTYRVRDYASKEDPWDGRDRKKWTRMVTPNTDEELAIDTARTMMTGLIQLSLNMGMIDPPGRIYELIRENKTPEEFGRWLMSMPWAHSMEATTH